MSQKLSHLLAEWFQNNIFQNLIVSSKNIEELRLTQWTIDSNDITFKAGTVFRLHTLTFMECGKYNFSNWKDYPHKFGNILKAVSESKLSETLRKIELWDNSITVDLVMKMMRNLKDNNWKSIKFELYDEEIDAFSEFSV